MFTYGYPPPSPPPSPAQLPYVPNPNNHPSFEALFQDGWVDELRHKLNRFLEVALHQVQTPELYTLLSSRGYSPRMGAAPPGGRGIGSADASGGGGDSYDRGPDGGMPQVGHLRELVRSMYGVTSEMLQVLESSAQGGTISSGFIRKFRGQISMFGEAAGNLKLGGLGMMPPAGGARPPLHNQMPPSGNNRTGHDHGRPPMPGSPGGQPAEAAVPTLASLNYAAIREDLLKLARHGPAAAEGKEAGGGKEDEGAEGKSGEDAAAVAAATRRCCRILQALRWRLTRSHAGAARRRVLQAYVQNDLIGMGRDGEGGPASSVIAALLHSNRPDIVEYACRFVNAVASECDGRSYLLSMPDLIPTLVDVLKSEDSDTVTRQNALGALQKFSLRRRAQTLMIEQGLIHWICDTLRRHHDERSGNGNGVLSEYTIEYATALLMNLSLRTLGKIKAEEPEVKILEVLNDFVESDNTQVRTYVNGTLYSVLTRPILKEQAMAMGMDEMLRLLMEHSQEQFRKQIEYILEQLSADVAATDGAAPDAASDEEDDEDVEADDDDEEDAEEEEVDDESLPSPDGDGVGGGGGGGDAKCGEELLLSLYLAHGGDSEVAHEESAMISESLRKKEREHELNRERMPDRAAEDDTMPLQRPVTPHGTHDRPPDEAPASEQHAGEEGTQSGTLRKVPDEMK